MRSIDNLYFLNESDVDKFGKYKIQDSFFFCIADSYSQIDGEDKKNNLVIGNFRIQVFSKKKKIEYIVKEIKVITKNEEFNISDILYLPYPYDKPLKTEFELDKKFTNFYSSWYWVRLFIFSLQK